MTRFAAVQMASGPQVAANLNEAARLIGKAASDGARLVALPENFTCMPIKDMDRLNVAEDFEDGAAQAFLADQSRTHGVWLVGGTIPLTTDDAGKVRAACLVYNDSGERVARYDKMHLFDVRLTNGEEYQESRTFDAGDEPVVVDTPFGKLGLAVCYDLRFPELFRRLVDAGAQIIVIPSAFTAHTGRAHWETLVRARAIENLVFMVAPAQGGYHINGRETHGDTMIVNPWGEVLGRLVRGSGAVVADCDLSVLRNLRRSLPCLEHRKLRV
jgi:nitrilase